MEGVPGLSGVPTYTKKKIFEILRPNFGADLNTQIRLLEEDFAKVQNVTQFEVNGAEKNDLKKVLCNMKSRWKASNYTLDRFLSKNEKWLESSVTLKNIVTRSRSRSSESRTMGRPLSEEFESVGERRKKRRTDGICSSLSTQRSLRDSGSVVAANVLKDMTTSSSPTRATKYKEAITTAATPRPIEMSPDEALVDIVNSKLTKQQYIDLRSSLRDKQIFAYPSYHAVLEAKKRCCPVGIAVTETSAEVDLQSLLDHTCQRILKVQQEFINTLRPQLTSDLRCIIKWGCDGSSGQSQYQQKFSDESSSDANIFLASLVPLQIVGVDNEAHEEIVVWKNPRPSSTRFCRPIRLQFLHENTESTSNEEHFITSQIDTLVPYETFIDGKQVVVKYEMHFTMIDGKEANAVTETKSAMRCHLCKAMTTEFNNIEKMKKREIDYSGLKYGLSTLHAWIRCFECLLHIGYELGIHKWQARGDTGKDTIKQRKCIIQKAFKCELHLNIDSPKPGYGSSNDGNTARRFFENSPVSARILGVDETLINKFHAILQVLSSGFAVNAEVFQNFCFETAEMFVNLYPWYCMPTSVHTILIHGAKIVEWAPLPIGQLSEDAQEARNKDIQKYREHFSGKCARDKTMEDVFQRMMITSDPYISSMGKQLNKVKKSFSPEAMAMIICNDADGSVDMIEDEEECR